MKKLALFAALLLSCAAAGQPESQRYSIDVQIGPRALLLSGRLVVDSPSGRYIIEFPYPNNCVTIGPINAASIKPCRKAVSR